MQALLNVAVMAARRAGDTLIRKMRSPEKLKIEEKGFNDYVSDADRAAEQAVIATVQKHYPGHAFLAEESGVTGDSDHVWIIDPLDGTTNYLYGFPGFNVSIAADIDDLVVASAVYDVVRDELFSAHLGGGATRNGEPIAPSPVTDLAHALVGTGFSYDAERRRRQAEVLVQVLPRVRDIRRQGAAAVDLCSVACGRLDAYYERGLARWDLAGGGLVATEAGAVVTDFDGGPAEAGAVLAAGPGVAGALLDLLATTDVANA